MRHPARQRGVLGWLAVAAAAGAVTLALAGVGGAGAQEPPEAETIPRGDGLYTVHCARCHGADGGGGLEGRAPALVGMEAARVDLVLRTNRMPPGDDDGSRRGPVDWDDESREILVAHLTALFDLEEDIPEAGAGDPARGREVFATHCAACHGYTGAGGVAGGGAITPALLGLDHVVVAEAIRVGPFQMPRFGPEQITDEEVDDVIGYLDEVAHEAGTPLNLVELNPVIASAFVAALSLVALLSILWIGGRVAMFPDPGEQPPETPLAAHGRPSGGAGGTAATPPPGEPPRDDRTAGDEEAGR